MEKDMVYVNMENNEWMLVMYPYEGMKAKGTKTSPEKLANEHFDLATKTLGIPWEIAKGGSVKPNPASSIRAFISEIFRARNSEAWKANPIENDTELWYIPLK